ncbi:MAG: 16S rRNA (uracil(1498)-N(3))-methyltransferase [Candidatus Riflebacteria bacterium]|nr:16S rRNA (uracil(1498)-N(3))-methyltransferase [Candidatus Riflebacteria bacterium]
MHKRIYEPKGVTALSKENTHYLEKVMRLKPGNSFLIIDGEGEEIEAILGEKGNFKITSRSRPDRELQIETRLFAAITKGDRIETLIEKSVEIGILRITPLLAERCVAGSPSPSKLDRWRKIAVSAMLQCGGCILPNIDDPIKTSEIPESGENTLAILLHEVPKSNEVLPPDNLQPSNTKFNTCSDQIRLKRHLFIASGPEGGFSENEAAIFQEKGWQSVCLGKRIFRADTAPLVALSAILFGEVFANMKLRTF